MSKQAFNELMLKEQTFQVHEPASQAKIQEMFKNISLDDTLNPKSTTADLKKLPKLASYLLQREKLLLKLLVGIELQDMSAILFAQ